MGRRSLEIPKFKSDGEEADWRDSPAGREYVKQRSVKARSKGGGTGAARLVAKLNAKRSVQIAIRLPGADLDRARELAERKGIGYQTLLKMLVHEGLAREARRQ